MLIYDDIYSWEGWGGRLKLASGRCYLRIFNQSEEKGNGVSFLKPYLVVASDLPESKMSIRSCAGHIATNVTREFSLDPHRMLWIEYYESITYGAKTEFTIPEQYVMVEFSWFEGKAVNPKWRHLNAMMLKTVRSIIHQHLSPS